MKQIIIMNKEEYLAEKKAISNRFNDELRALDKRYASSNNIVKIGDVVTDHATTILVERIILAYDYSGIPTVKLRGFRLKKNGKPTKQKIHDEVFMPNVRFVNKKPYKYQPE